MCISGKWREHENFQGIQNVIEPFFKREMRRNVYRSFWFYKRVVFLYTVQGDSLHIFDIGTIWKSYVFAKRLDKLFSLDDDGK